MKKVLITGSSGFLGSNLMAYFDANNVEYTPISTTNADLTIDSSLNDFVKNGHEYDHIFHLAAWTQAGNFCDTQRGIQWIVNQKINTNVLHWWKEKAPQAKLIAFGTSVSYTTEEGLTEEKYLDGRPYDKFYAYAHSKRMLLIGLECLHKQYGLNYLYLIPSTIYGKEYHTDSRQPHFIYDLIRKILRGKLNNESVILWGDGEQRRELIYINDFINIMNILNKSANNDIFNIGGGIDYSIKQFAAKICEIVDYDFTKIQYDTAQYVGARSKILNIDKSSLFIKNTSFEYTSLQKGLEATIEWYLQKVEGINK